MSACCFFLFLATANVWLNKIDNTILVFGYRFFIILAPLFLVLTKKWIAFFSFFVATSGVVLWFGDQNLLGAVLFSAGIAVGGYVLKYYTSKTAEGVSGNRVALNLGSCVAGVSLFLPVGHYFFLWTGLLLMVVTLITAFFIGEEAKEETIIQKNNFSFSKLLTLKGCAWAIIGIVAGMRVSSLFSVLPQFLIHYYGKMPSWYGLMILLDGIMVIFLQIPIMAFMKRFNCNQALNTLLISMAIIAVPNLFFCQTVVGAAIWTFLIVILECAVSYLDIFSREDGGLFIKEFFMAVGMAATVFIMRSLDPITAAFLIGATGFIATLTARKMLLHKMKSAVKPESDRNTVFASEIAEDNGLTK